MTTQLADAFFKIFGFKQSRLSCVMAFLDNADYIPNISKELLSENIYNNEDNEYGIEYESHITLLYGLHSDNSTDILKYVMDIKPFDIVLGKISKFSAEDYDVIKLDVVGEELHRINSMLKCLPYTNSYKDYIPHLTLGYVNKNSCDHLLGADVFKDHKFTINRIVFSDSRSRKTTFIL